MTGLALRTAPAPRTAHCRTRVASSTRLASGRRLHIRQLSQQQLRTQRCKPRSDARPGAPEPNQPNADISQAAPQSRSWNPFRRSGPAQEDAARSALQNIFGPRGGKAPSGSDGGPPGGSGGGRGVGGGGGGGGSDGGGDLTPDDFNWRSFFPEFSLATLATDWQSFWEGCQYYWGGLSAFVMFFGGVIALVNIHTPLEWWCYYLREPVLALVRRVLRFGRPITIHHFYKLPYTPAELAIVNEYAYNIYRLPSRYDQQYKRPYFYGYLQSSSDSPLPHVDH